MRDCDIHVVVLSVSSASGKAPPSPPVNVDDVPLATFRSVNKGIMETSGMCVPFNFLAKRKLYNAVRTPPICSGPVGLGANLTLIGFVSMICCYLQQNYGIKIRKLSCVAYSYFCRLIIKCFWSVMNCTFIGCFWRKCVMHR